MSLTPLEWGIGESIPIDLDIEDPNTGLGLTGQSSFITLTIQRQSDGYYWTNSAWSVTLTVLTFTEVDTTNQPGRYLYTLSTTANASADRYITHAKIYNPPTITGESYELHVSRDKILDVYSGVAA